MTSRLEPLIQAVRHVQDRVVPVLRRGTATTSTPVGVQLDGDPAPLVTPPEVYGAPLTPGGRVLSLSWAGHRAIIPTPPVTPHGWTPAGLSHPSMTAEEAPQVCLDPGGVAHLAGLIRIDRGLTWRVTLSGTLPVWAHPTRSYRIPSYAYWQSGPDAFRPVGLQITPTGKVLVASWGGSDLSGYYLSLDISYPTR